MYVREVVKIRSTLEAVLGDLVGRAPQSAHASSTVGYCGARPVTTPEYSLLCASYLRIDNGDFHVISLGFTF